uniref:Uncharacterized protein n=1 Tax=Geospiza parvula TaxID=87175 RepID=A0A8C3MVV1_GEOPR
MPAVPVHVTHSWCPLSPTGAQTTQLLVEPPWRPAVLWDRVTLTCQGSGTAGATTWYKDGQRWAQEGQHRLTVTERGTYTCDRPGTGRSPPVTVSDDPLVLQVPAQALLEGDTVTLRCRGSLRRTKLSLSSLQLHHSGRYGCEGLVGSWQSRSAAVTVTAHGEHPHGWNSNLLTPLKPLHSRLRITVLTSSLLPRALPCAGAGGSPRSPPWGPP